MKAKKQVSALLSILMLITMLSACNVGTQNTLTTQATTAGTNLTTGTTSKSAVAGTSATTTSSATTAAATATAEQTLILSEPGVLPMVNMPVTLTIGLQKSPTVTDYEDNYLTHLLEERTGITLDFHFFSEDTAEAVQQFELLIAANADLPDIISRLPLTDSARQRYGQDGVFIELRDLIKENGYWMLQALDSLDDATEEKVWAYGTSPDGGFYGWPWFYTAFSDAVAMGFAHINQAWLDKLGIAKPTTTTELYDTLTAFRDKDPNGNGKVDEIPMAGANEYNWDPKWYLMNCFTYMPESYLIAENGVVDVCYTGDDFREGLAYMAKLVEENLLYSGSFTQTSAQLRAMTDLPQAEASIVGSTFGWAILLFSIDENYSTKALDYDDRSPVKNPRGTTFAARTGDWYEYDTYITKNCKYPALAAKFLDYINEPTEILTSVSYGEKGVDWREAQPGEKAKYPVEGLRDDLLYTSLTELSGIEHNKTWNHNIASISSHSWGGLNTYVPSENPLENHEAEELITGVLNRMSHEMAPEERVDRIIYTTEELDEISELQTTLKTYVETSISRFAIGDLKLDKDWDTYMSDLNDIGLPRYLEIVNQAYTRMNG